MIALLLFALDVWLPAIDESMANAPSYRDLKLSLRLTAIDDGVAHLGVTYRYSGKQPVSLFLGMARNGTLEDPAFEVLLDGKRFVRLMLFECSGNIYDDPPIPADVVVRELKPGASFDLEAKVCLKKREGRALASVGPGTHRMRVRHSSVVAKGRPFWLDETTSNEITFAVKR